MSLLKYTFLYLELLHSNILTHVINNNKSSKSCCRIKLFSSRLLSSEVICSNSPCTGSDIQKKV